MSLRGELLEISGAKLPGMVKGAIEEVLYDRMYLYEELHSIVTALLTRYATERVGEDWKEVKVPEMRAWVSDALASVAGDQIP